MKKGKEERKKNFMDYNFKTRLKYINWHEEAKQVNVSHEKYNEKLEELKKKRKPAQSKTIRKEWMTGKVYAEDHKGNWMQLYFNDPVNHQYYIWASNPFKDVQDEEVAEQARNLGTKSMKIFAREFMNRNADFTLKQAFGYSPETVKKCITKQFYYTNDYYMEKKLTHISAIDGTSQFLSNARGPLPDWGTAKQYDGTVEPNEDYPFAFYLNSGHYAEYGKFDTHRWGDLYPDWYKYVMADDRFHPCKPQNDITVLCKKSNFELTEVLEYFYNRRSIDPDAKGIVNRTIGFMHQSHYATFKLAHIAAVTIARSNNQMLQMVEKIGRALVLHIAVDGIIYIGKKEYGEEKKQMGHFFQEFTDCSGLIAQANCYIIQDQEGRYIKEKHSGFNKDNYGREITLSNIKSLEDYKKWKRVDPINNCEIIYKGRSYLNGNDDEEEESEE